MTAHVQNCLTPSVAMLLVCFMSLRTVHIVEVPHTFYCFDFNAFRLSLRTRHAQLSLNSAAMVLTCFIVFEDST